MVEASDPFPVVATLGAADRTESSVDSLSATHCVVTTFAMLNDVT